MTLPERIALLRFRITQCDAPAGLRLIGERLQTGEGGYICFTNAHAAVMCCQDAKFCAVTNDSFMSVADGKPVYWAARLKGGALGHMPGPDFMLRVLREFPQRRHFFYGSAPKVLAALTDSLQSSIPQLNVCGTLSPPFRVLTPEEIQANYQTIRDSKADFVWVGLGAPKQELWMAEAWQSLRPAILLGVGAAFDFHAGAVRRAPALFRFLGLEWLFRLLQEPKRLWRRYLVTNTLFIYYLVRDSLSRTR